MKLILSNIFYLFYRYGEGYFEGRELGTEPLFDFDFCVANTARTLKVAGVR